MKIKKSASKILSCAVTAYLMCGSAYGFAAGTNDATQMVTDKNNTSSEQNSYSSIIVTEDSPNSIYMDRKHRKYVTGVSNKDRSSVMELYLGVPAEGTNNISVKRTIKENPAFSNVLAAGAFLDKNGLGLNIHGTVNMVVETQGYLADLDSYDNIFGSAHAYGLMSDSKKGKIVLDADGNKFVIKAQGGKGDAGAEAKAFAVNDDGGGGIVLGNNNSFEVTAIGGEAGSGAGDAAWANGIVGSNLLSIGNNNSIKVSATGGKLTSDAWATGIENGKSMDSDAAMTIGDGLKMEVKAESGSVEIGTNVATDAYGVKSLYDTNIGKNAVINVTASGGKVLNHDAKNYDFLGAPATAYGVNANGGTVNIDSGAQISVNATVQHQAPNTPLAAYALFADGTGTKINVNKDSAADGNATQINGDVVAIQEGTIDLVLDTKDSYLKGAIAQTVPTKYAINAPIDEGKVNLTLDNGAKWEIAKISYRYQPERDDPNAKIELKYLFDNVIDINTINMGKGAVIDLTADEAKRIGSWRTLQSTGDGGFNIKGSENTFILNSDLANNAADKIVVQSTTGKNYIKIGFDPFFERGTLTGKEKALVVDTMAGGGTFAGAATDYGLNKYTAKLTQEGDDWYLTGFNKGNISTVSEGSVTAQQIGYMTDVNYSLARVLNNNLNKRLGELRDRNDEAGAWIRMYNGENEVGSNITQKYTIGQGGYDGVSHKDNADVYRGAFFEYGSADNAYLTGSGKTTSKSLGLYQTCISDNGRYNDIVFKGSRLSNDMDFVDFGDNRVNADYDQWAYSLSAEYGFRKTSANGCFYQPHVELAYTRVNGVDYAARAAKWMVGVQQDAYNSIVGSLGMTIGKTFNEKSNMYLSANLMHEFGGDFSVKGIDYNGDIYHLDKDLSDTWVQLIAGTNVTLNDNSNLYFNIEKTMGGEIDTKWQWNAGLRRAF